jgi:hypothetical protein
MMRVFARLEGEQVVITVRDNGRWREPDLEPGWRGRGIPLIAELTDDADIDPDPAAPWSYYAVQSSPLNDPPTLPGPSAVTRRARLACA